MKKISMITAPGDEKDSVLRIRMGPKGGEEAIGKHRVRQVSIESELYFARKAQKHPTEIGIPAPDRVRLQELLKQLEVDGRIKSYGIGSGGADKVYEVIDGDDSTA